MLPARIFSITSGARLPLLTPSVGDKPDAVAGVESEGQGVFLCLAWSHKSHWMIGWRGDDGDKCCTARKLGVAFHDIRDLKEFAMIQEEIKVIRSRPLHVTRFMKG